MNREKHARDIVSILRASAIMLFMVGVINWVCLMRDDLNLRYFLLGFNGVLFLTMMVVIFFLDWKKEKLVREL
jgi:amino acid permease